MQDKGDLSSSAVVSGVAVSGLEQGNSPDRLWSYWFVDTETTDSRSWRCLTDFVQKEGELKYGVLFPQMWHSFLLFFT